MIEIFIFIVAAFFCMNMGAPSFAGSFATAVGSKALNRWQAGSLFTIFALLGAIFLGAAVTKTLGKDIVPTHLLDKTAVLLILSSATISLFTANIMKVPQSTSLSTLAAICGVGFYHHSVAWGKIQYMLFWWILAVGVSFFSIYFTTKYVYPPRKINFWIYEKIINYRERLAWLVILTSCYKGFAQGSNNVANAVGPLVAAGLIDTFWGLLIMGVIFGIGSFIFTGPLDTSSEKIVPLGLLTATVINIISGTITIIASKLGLPLPTVIVYTVAIFAIGSVKDGMRLTMVNPATKKTFFTWVINPILTFGIAYLLAVVFLNNKG